MNPEKMRNTYGKLMYLLQDSQIPEVKEMLEFDTLKPIVTVYHTLSEAACLPILRDELILAATMEITSTYELAYFSLILLIFLNAYPVENNGGRCSKR